MHLHQLLGCLQNCHARMSQIPKLWSMLQWATWRESANEACPLLPMTLWSVGFFRPRTSHHLIELKIGRIPEHWHFAFEALIGQNLQHTDSTIDSLWSQVVLMVILCHFGRPVFWCSLQRVGQVMTIVRSSPPCPGLLLTGLHVLNIIKKNESLGQHQLCL